MEFLADWKFWLFVVTLSGIIINWLANQKIMNNHLKHLDEKVDKVIQHQEKSSEDMKQLEVDVAYIKGKTETDSEIVEILKKTIK